MPSVIGRYLENRERPLGFNLVRHRLARGSSTRPYPVAQDVFMRSSFPRADEDFRDLYLNDLINANRRVARQKLHQLEMSTMHRHLLSRGIQELMDVEERRGEISSAVDASIGYAGSLGVMAMDEIATVNEKVGLGPPWIYWELTDVLR